MKAAASPTASRPPAGAGARRGERVRGPAVAHQDFSHDALGVAAELPHVARARDEAEVAQAAFDRTQAAVAAAVEVDFAGARLAPRAFEVSFEGD